MQQFFTIYTSAELICFITALVCLLNDKAVHWRLLVPFMLITTMVEMGAIPLKAVYIANPEPINSSAWIYNILLVLQIGAFNFVFYNIIKKYVPVIVFIISGVAILFLIYGYELSSNLAGIFNYNSGTYTVMSVIFILYSLYYYYLLLNNVEHAKLDRLPEFWWVTGTLFFFFGTTACNLFYVKLLSFSEANKIYLSYINNVLIVILYGCWSYSFICRRWMTLNT